eukprot:751237-Hanusia_phi.AAC.4
MQHEPASVAMVELHPQGAPVEAFLQDLKGRWAGGGGGQAAGRNELLVFLGDDKGLNDQDSLTIQEIASKVGARYHKVALGGSMLLASHCIVVLNFLLDSVLHSCPQKLWDAPGGQTGDDKSAMTLTAGKLVEKRRKQTQARRKKHKKAETVMENSMVLSLHDDH